MREIRHKLGIAFVLLLFLAGCAPAAPATPAVPAPAYWPTNGWRSAVPEEQGMDSEKLAQMAEHIQQEKLPLHSLLVVRNGYLVSEIYGYPYAAGQVHFVASVTKSVMSTLVGIAIQKGAIKNVQQTLSSLLPDQAASLDDKKKAITLENFLTMTSGLDCHENAAPGEAVMQASSNWLQFVLDLPMAAQPGAQFNYCTGAVEVLSAILQKATGMSALDYANQNLFTPLGIGPLSNAYWPSDPQGLTIGGYGLSLTPTEMAKLGFLFLHQGQWDGKTVVPTSWVATATASHANKYDKKEYGYLWWVDPQGKWYAALGLGGQHVFVYPAQNLVVVFTASLPLGNDADLIPLEELLNQYILPAISGSGQPLPANPAGVARLQAGIKALAQPALITPGALPAIAAQISGKTYAIDSNPFGWQTLVFSFQPGASEASININGTGTAAIGLDNVYRTVPGSDNAFPQVVRGRWESQDTFVIEVDVLGQMTETTARVQFAGDAIHITWQEKFTGSKVEVQGKVQIN